MRELYIKYALHLDILREDSGIKISDFVEGVCDRRTYSRYVNGERVMSQKIVNGLCNKLRMTPLDFLESYNFYDKTEYQEIVKLYTHISNKNFKEARVLLTKYDNSEFVNLLAKRLYDYCVIEYNLRSKSITKAHAYDLHSQLIDYPKCLKKTKFTLQDIMSIRSIAMLEFEIEEYKGLYFLKEFLGESKYQLVSSDSRDILPYIYTLVSKRLGMLGDIENSLKVSEKGLVFCLKSGTINELEKLYYYSMLSAHKLNDFDKRDKYARRDVSLLYALYEEDYIKWRLDMISRDISEEFVLKALDSIQRT